MDSLADKIARRAPLIGAAVGSGMTAAAAEAGGVDFVMVLNAGHFRVQGCSSSAALMPYADANALTLETAARSVMPRLEATPVFLGLCAQDPQRAHGQLFAAARDLGAVGVTNFPSVGFLDGQFREAIEESGLGYGREVEMIAGLMTIAFCFRPEEAALMAEARADVLLVNLGFTRPLEKDPSRHQARLDEAVERVRACAAAAPAHRCVMVIGGPVLLPQDTTQIYRRTGAIGYVGGSAIERFPAAPLIRQSVRDFREAAEGSRRLRRLGALIGAGPAMERVFEMIQAVAESDAPVLITGESGVGKELAAREIHRLSRRSARPLVTWNCGAVAESLAMSELFGHERGAFTGASQRRLGKFEQADGATLFMDEVTELPASVQASLLRVLQEGELVRVGGERTVPVDVRLVAATNRSLPKVILSGAFRHDLYYRLSTVVLELPPLRERPEDIPFLAMEFAREFAQRQGVPTPLFSEEVLRGFRAHPWPGNIRELRNAIERLVLLGRGERVDLAWLKDMLELGIAVHGSSSPAPGQPATRRGRLAEVLEYYDGNKAAAARELGISRKTLYQWLKAGA